jgi:hypothetical protein
MLTASCVRKRRMAITVCDMMLPTPAMRPVIETHINAW